MPISLRTISKFYSTSFKMSMRSHTREVVLNLYRRIIRLSYSWNAVKPENSEIERNYIRDEARRLFKQNRSLKNEKEIADRIYEAEARVDLALHYRIPYPRPVNFPPQSLAMKKGKEQGTFQERLKKRSKPIYIKSDE